MFDIKFSHTIHAKMGVRPYGRIEIESDKPSQRIRKNNNHIQKMKIQTSIATIAIALLSTSQIHAVSYELAPVTVTIALTSKWAVPGTFLRDSSGKITNFPAVDATWTIKDKNGNTVSDNSVSVAKPYSFKYGNKEFLGDLALYGNGLLPDGATSKGAGWVLYATPKPADQNGIGYTKVFARKKGFSDVDLTSLFAISTPGSTTVPQYGTLQSAGPLTFSGSQTILYNPDGSKKSVTRAGTYGIEGPVYGGLIWNPNDSSSFGITAGLLIGTATEFIYAADPAIKTEITVLGVPGAVTISSIVGSEGGPGSVTGSIAFSASKAVKLP